MFLNKISIKNFRSIGNRVEIDLGKLSIFVGNNDAGKSNVLKALNFFFNSKTDYNKEHNFREDYSLFAYKRSNMAEEIEITLELQVPKNYKVNQNIIWKKIWRKNGLHKDEFKFIDGSPIPTQTKIVAWIKNLRFTYIPAIRDQQYFQQLLSDLHDCFAETIEKELRSAGNEFIKKIQTYTSSISDQLDKKIGLPSEIELPSNLQSLFRSLEFITLEGEDIISLTNRGDGIKSRHIPIILKFISEQLNINKVKGSPNINMIWGFEEPENNLEWLATSNLANSFAEYTKDIQILVTTHSPSFYNLKFNSLNENIKLFQVGKSDGIPSTILEINDKHEVDNKMGLMPIIAPYIAEKEKEINQLSSNLNELEKKTRDDNKDLIVVEGKDEERIYKLLIHKYDLHDRVRISFKSNGCSGVKNEMMALCYLQGTNQNKAIGVFDYDNAGVKEWKELIANKVYIKANNNKKVKALKYFMPTHLNNIKNRFPNFPIELEEMYSPWIWNYAMNKKWLVMREYKEIQEFCTPDRIDQTIEEKIVTYKFSDNEKIYIYYKIPDIHKDKVSKYISANVKYVNRNIPSVISFFESKILPFFN